MIQAVRDGLRGVHGVWRVTSGEDDSHSYFDVSMGGLVRSFVGAALMAAPIYALFMIFVDFTVAAVVPDAPPTPVVQRVVMFVAMWVYFPVVAAVICRLLARGDAFAPWVVVHNWAVVFVLIIQTVPWLMYTAGLASLGATALLSRLAFVFTLFVHYRVAREAFGGPWYIGAGAAGAAALTWQVLQALIARAYETTPVSDG